MDVAHGYCKCGCGRRTMVNAETRHSRGWVKGEPRDYVRGHQARGTSRGESFWERVDKNPGPTECWLWTAMIGGRMGYGRFKFRGVVVPAHRAAWELTHGKIPNGLLVLHHCDNPPCCNPAHLFLGTQKENLADRDRKGRGVFHRGVNNAASKLTPDAVLALRKRHAAGESQRSLAREFGVSQGTVSLVVRRLVWREV